MWINVAVVYLCGLLCGLVCYAFVCIYMSNFSPAKEIPEYYAVISNPVDIDTVRKYVRVGLVCLC